MICRKDIVIKINADQKGICNKKIILPKGDCNGDQS